MATEYDALTVADLRAELEARGLATDGTKPELVARLVADDGPAAPAEGPKVGDVVQHDVLGPGYFLVVGAEDVEVDDGKGGKETERRTVVAPLQTVTVRTDALTE